MTPIPTAVTFTAAEAAALSGTGGNPYPDEKLELPKEEGDGTDTAGTAGTAGTATPGSEGDTGRGVGTDKSQDEQAGDAAEPDGEADAEEDEDGDIEVRQDDPNKPRRKFVEIQKFDAVRHKAAGYKGEITKLREQLAFLQGLSQNAKPAPTQQQAPQEIPLTPPDKTKEPEKYLAWLETAAAKAIQFEHQNRQQSEQTTQFQQLNQAVMQHEQAFVNGDGETEAHPDFYDAVKFLQDRHRAELHEAGYQPHEIQQIMAARAQSVAVKALQAGKSPAERVYSLAKLNGYKKAAPVVKETEAEKIARQAEKQAKAPKSIADLPGGESKGLTAETLANMDPKEFLKSWTSGEAKKVMGWNE